MTEQEKASGAPAARTAAITEEHAMDGQKYYSDAELTQMAKDQTASTKDELAKQYSEAANANAPGKCVICGRGWRSHSPLLVHDFTPPPSDSKG